MNVFSNSDFPGMNNSLTMSPNFTSNTTSEYEDPVVLFISAITSATALNYALTGLCVILFILFVLPLIGITLFSIINYGIVLAIHLVFRLKYRLKHGKSGIDADKARQVILNWWYWVSKIWFGFEVIGIENIPVDDPGIMVCPHAKTPAHIPPLRAILSPYRCRNYHLVIDKNHGNNPIFRDFSQTFNMAGWTREECVKILQEGSDLVTLPGGSQELLHSDSNYEIDWSNRKGYARVAKEAKVFIVPMFCLNLQEAFWTPFFLKPFVSGRFSSKKFPIFFAWGGLPVKLVLVIIQIKMKIEFIAERAKRAKL
uniref:Phospholipid/glycerol acyltransferase domain-containing protein n=1 Tax=Strigamia maritima TaxID=126957 RepID=T1IJH2_STRMM